MRFVLPLLFFFLLLNPCFVKADEYHLSVNSYLPAHKDTFITNQVLKEKSPATALALCVLLGPLGVHRIYLGTSKTTAVAYIATGAGFGLLWIADTILIIRALARKDASDISNNRHFFLWNK